MAAAEVEVPQEPANQPASEPPELDATTGEDAETHPEPLPVLTAMDRLAVMPAAAPRPTSLNGAWALSIVLLLGIAAATMVWRQDIMAFWPASGRILIPIDRMLGQPGQVEGKKAG